ncbi:recombination regulator RecX [Myxococcus sp. K15C18031901]|uniref:regulatory protein RecX n=1 Tax=Myxococcus dinghuensis TaxID=2906761 RepID=UPI0020A812F0|nr:regulatory protein RecX [Myxococcus dinghuensis]MCP3103832.1 recombination regulator RecX [Myxococcus dinghuensis]
MLPEDEGPEAVQRATDVGVKLLGARARTRHELDAALEKKGFAPAVRDAALARLEGWGYLDDARFGRARAEVLLRDGKGPGAVLQRLAAHGLSDDAAREALQDASTQVDFDAPAAARAVLRKRGLAARPSDGKAWAKAARLLSGRGFSPDVVHQVLGEPPLDPSGRDE